MDLDGKSLKADVGTDLEVLVGKEMNIINISNVSGSSELGGCPRCFELEEKCKKAEDRCTMLELDFERNKRELELLESKLAVVTLDKLAFEDEVCILEKANEELQKKFIDNENCNMPTPVDMKGMQDVESIAEVDKTFELMMENNALNAEVGVLEAKCMNLELHVAKLESCLYSKDGECSLSEMVEVGLVSSGGCRDIGEVNDLQCGFDGAATPVTDTLFSNVANFNGAKSDVLHGNVVSCTSRARKQLFLEEGAPVRKMVPKTPASVRHPPVCPIDISDSDDEKKTTNLPVLDIQARAKVSGMVDAASVVSLDGKELTAKKNLTGSPDQSNEDDVPCCNSRASFKLSARRKRAFNLVTSDTGSDTDDNVPICRLRKEYPPESVVLSPQNNSMTAAASGNKNGKPIPRRRLVPLRKQYKGGTIKECPFSDLHSNETQSLKRIPTIGINDTEEDESDAKDESLDGFIVGSSDSEDDEGNNISTSDERSTGESDDASDSNMNYGDIISRIGRRKDHLLKWVFEADMLAALGKDPELCMKAVCALYRKQTSEEKLSKATIFANQRGFSQCDAVRGSRLGEFLTNGDPLGDLKKSVKELQEHDPKGVELCRTLATHYSKQLFAMYENKEDPLWPALGLN